MRKKLPLLEVKFSEEFKEKYDDQGVALSFSYKFVGPSKIPFKPSRISSLSSYRP